MVSLNTHSGDKKCIYNFSRSHGEPIVSLRREWEHNIKMDLE